MTLNHCRLSREIVAELGAFTQMLSANPEIPKPSGRFIAEALRGLLQNQSVLLSQIARATHGSENLLYREQRLSYQLANNRWDPLSAESLYLQWAARQIKQETIIALDTGDIAKKYAKAMPGLGIIWDGSAKNTAKGYPLIEIEAIGTGGKHIPLYLDALSTRKAAYVSQNHQINMAVDFVISHIGRQGVWVMDRGFDDEKRFKFLDERNLSWVIRARGDRIVEQAGRPEFKAMPVWKWAKRPRKTFRFKMRIEGRIKTLKGGFLPVALPGEPNVTYYLAAVWINPKRPWYLMTNLAIKTFKDFARVIEVYAARWGVEDAARVLKQSFDLENIRLLTFQGIRKMVWLALWAYGFLCHIGHWPRKSLGILLTLVHAFQDWEELKIVYYRVADAIAEVLFWPPPGKEGSWEGSLDTGLRRCDGRI